MSFFKPARRASRAFTLIELLTVIAIIGILAAIIIPTVGKVRTTARNAQCVANIREWQRSIILYANDNKGTYSVSNFGSTGSGPYKPYFGNSGEFYKRVRACPMLSQERIDAGTLTYTIVRGSINGNISSLAPAGLIPLSRARNPSQYLLIADSRANSNTPLNGAESSITDLLGPLFDPANTDETNTRHGSKSLNGAFADGSVRRITGTLAGQGDQQSAYERRTTWFQLY